MTDILSRLGGETVMVARARSRSGESLQSTGLGSNGKIDDNLERRVSMRYCAMHALVLNPADVSEECKVSCAEVRLVKWHLCR